MTGTSDELLLRKMAPKATRVEFKSAAEIALAVSSGRADAFTTTVLASMVTKSKNPGLGDFVNPTPRVALPGYIGLRLEDDARWQKFLNRWAEWNILLGHNETRMKAALQTRGPRDPVDRLVLAELMTKTVTVIGAGIVGVCCALHLQREGFTVRLVEKGEPGMKASFGNSGSFGTASCVPFAMPGVLKKVPKMLFDSESPLKLRWSHVPRALPWFLRFIEAARPSRVEAIAAARNSLLVHTHAGYAPLIEGADAGKWVKDDGLMMTFESEAAFEGAAYALDLRRRHGVHMDILDGNEARQMEPALSPRVIKAVSLPDVSRTIDPLRLTEALADDFVRRGGEIVNAEVRGFEIGSDGPTKILTDRGPLDVELVVLAAGVWSRPLAASSAPRCRSRPSAAIT